MGAMFDLTGRRALVTGASGEIGAAIARALAGQGARLALSGRKQAALEALAGELAGELGGAPGAETVLAPGDLAAEDGPQAVAAQARAGLGGVDILINNAGMTRDMLAMRLSDADWRAVLELDLTAAFRLTRALLRDMIKARFGRVISISSVVARAGNPGQANYAAAKAGLEGMSRALAQEVAGRGITVNCIAPGVIDSAMTRDLDDVQRQRILARVPQGRLGTGRDVAGAALYLASEAAGYVTGETLHVNGGMAMF